MDKRREGKGEKRGIRRAEIKELLEDLEYALEYPQPPPFCVILSATFANDVWLEVRDKLHELGEDENPRLREWDKRFVKAAGEYRITYREEYRKNKPLSRWWWWLDKILKGELPKNLLPAHVRNLFS